MASYWIFSSCILISVITAWPNPQTFIFDRSSSPGPLQECSSGIPTMSGPIPFSADTPLNDDRIGMWVERYIECLWGNYLNNVEHVDWVTLTKDAFPSDYELCFHDADAVETCVNKDGDRMELEKIRDRLDINGGIAEVVDVDQRSVTIALKGSAVLMVAEGELQPGHTFEEYSIETIVFNDDGTVSKKIVNWIDEIASSHLSPTYFVVDVGNVNVRVFVAFVTLWLLCAPLGMVWIAMQCCNGQKTQKYSMVDVVSSDSET